MDVAVKVALAKKQNAAPYQQEKALLENDLLSFARNRDEDEVVTIRDTRNARAVSELRKLRGW